MKIEQSTWRDNKGWLTTPPGKLKSAQWVLTFGSRDLLQEPDHDSTEKTLKAGNKNPA